MACSRTFETASSSSACSPSCSCASPAGSNVNTVRRIRMIWFLDEPMLSIYPPTVRRRHRFSTTHAERATTVPAKMHTYISNQTHQRSTNRHFSFVFTTIRCAAIAPSRNDSFFVHNQDNPFRTSRPNRYNPTDTILHPRYIRIRTYPNIHRSIIHTTQYVPI
jgi:hypothetical protein